MARIVFLNISLKYSTKHRVKEVLKILTVILAKNKTNARIYSAICLRKQMDNNKNAHVVARPSFVILQKICHESENSKKEPAYCTPYHDSNGNP